MAISGWRRPSGSTFFSVQFNTSLLGVRLHEGRVTEVQGAGRRLGICVGDLWHTVDGTSVEKRSDDEIISLIRQSPRPLKVVFERKHPQPDRLQLSTRATSAQGGAATSLSLTSIGDSIGDGLARALRIDEHARASPPPPPPPPRPPPRDMISAQAEKALESAQYEWGPNEARRRGRDGAASWLSPTQERAARHAFLVSLGRAGVRNDHWPRTEAEWHAARVFSDTTGTSSYNAEQWFDFAEMMMFRAQGRIARHDGVTEDPEDTDDVLRFASFEPPDDYTEMQYRSEEAAAREQAQRDTLALLDSPSLPGRRGSRMR
jgi:hypothetical protein